jgi:hypothetical protein
MTISAGDTGHVTEHNRIHSAAISAVALDSFAGANDDAKLAAAASYAAAQTYKGIAIALDQNRSYTFTQQLAAYDGLAIVGATRRPVDQARASLPIPNKVILNIAGGTGGGGWIVPPNGNCFGMHLASLSFDGNSTSRVIDLNTSGVLWNAIFRDISTQNLAGFIGTSSNGQPCDFVCMDGYWNINNVRDIGIAIQGSDNFLNFNGMNLDSPTSLLPATGWLARFQALSKTFVSGIYVTAEQHSAFDITGSNQRMNIRDCTIEGRNAGAPCYGALIRVTSSDVTLRDCWTSFAMSGGSNGRTDLGVIHINSGNVLIDGCTYQRATGVAESVPYIYVGGGNVTVRNIQRSGTWTGLPVVRHLGGTLDADSSVTVVTT